LIIPPILFIVVVLMYSFPARLLAKYESPERYHLATTFRYMILLLLWPIGIWLIQPRINKIQ
jgi:hypothetical protein